MATIVNSRIDKSQSSALLSKRGAGILIPISSLPSPYGIGTLGKAAYDCIDFLKKAGQRYWQVLPIGPTSYGDSPYQSFSAFAGNPYFIDLDILVNEGLLTKEEVSSVHWQEIASCVDYSLQYQNRFTILRKAFERSHHMNTKEYTAFCKENAFWLDDYSLFMACKFYFGGISWREWPENLMLHKEEAIKEYAVLLRKDVDFWKFCQFVFVSQWEAMQRYAHKNGVYIIGDIPIYVAMDSADVWANGYYFQLDENHAPQKVAGVPPDAFSEDGQLWGNPLYDWDALEKDNFSWWRERMAVSSRFFDCIRIDHFIGICRYFSIPSEDTSAKNGKYFKGPGMKLIKAIGESVGNSEIIAEDLGILVPQVASLLKKAGFPGMKVLQFAFDGRPDNDHLPYMYARNLVSYAGTHDNNTLVGWYETLPGKDRQRVSDYMNICDSEDISVAALRLLYGSRANTVIFQAQDILGLPGEDRMNYPSTLGNNWCWRLLPEQLTDALAGNLKSLAVLYGRN